MTEIYRWEPVGALITTVLSQAIMGSRVYAVSLASVLPLSNLIYDIFRVSDVWEVMGRCRNTWNNHVGRVWRPSLYVNRGVPCAFSGARHTCTVCSCRSKKIPSGLLGTQAM